MSHHHQGPEAADAYPRRWSALATLLLAGFMNLIDVTIVNVALPRLQTSLGATSTEIEWVVAAYVLAFALGLLPFGRLGDMIGRKRVFLTGIGAFHAVLGILRSGAVDGNADCRTRAAGARRRDDDAAGAGDRPDHLPAARARPGFLAVRAFGGSGVGRRAAGRWAADRRRSVRPGLAADLPGQYSGRNFRHHCRPGADTGAAATPESDGRFRRRGHCRPVDHCYWCSR